jgi:hypothetical protein
MAVGRMCMVRGFFVVASGMVLRRLPVVLGGVLVMLRRFGVVLGRFLGHGDVLQMLGTDRSDIRERREVLVNLIVSPYDRTATDPSRSRITRGVFGHAFTRN